MNKKRFTVRTFFHCIFVCLVLWVFVRTLLYATDDTDLGKYAFAKVSAEFVSNKSYNDDAINMWSVVVIQSEYQNEEWEENSVIEYTVTYGDSLSTIASTFGTTVKNIMEVNWLQSTNLRVWKRIHITPIEWFIFQLKEITNPMVFANQYWLSLEDFLTTNGINDKLQLLEKWGEVFIPLTRQEGIELGLLEKPKPVEPTRPVVAEVAHTIVQKKEQKQDTPTSVQKNLQQARQTQAVVSTPSLPQKSSITSQWTYTTNVWNWFYKWNCTQYAALKAPWAFPFITDKKQYKTRNWDAKYRKDRAEQQWFSTSSKPSIGAIAVFGRGRSWYSSAWHVWIVVDVDYENTRFMIEDMNYTCLHCVTRRRIDMNSAMTQVAWWNDLIWFIPKQTTPQWILDAVAAQQ